MEEAPLVQEDSVGQDVIDVVAELAAGTNRTVADTIDFMVTNPVRVVAEAFGYDERIPGVRDHLAKVGGEGGFMDPGMAQDIVRGAGQALPAAAAFPEVVSRNLASAGGATAEFLGVGSGPITKGFQSGKEMVSDLIGGQPRQSRLQEMQAASTDADLARLKLEEPKIGIGEQLDVVPRVVKDPVAGRALYQGFSEGVVQAVKQSAPTDRAAYRRMVSVMERGKKNARYATEHRPSDVAGELAVKRIAAVQQINTQAGKRLNGVAKGLKGKPVNYESAITGFVGALQEMGVRLVRNQDGVIKTSFKGSDIEGLSEPIALLNRMVSRLMNDNVMDAYDVHRLKRFIDEQVTFGKRGEGLTGKTDILVKDLRRNLDEALDSTFPAYDEVNTEYSATRNALDAFQDVAGKKMDLEGKNAAKAVGTLLYRLTGKAASRIPLLDSLTEIDHVAKQYSRTTNRMKGDLLNQILFVDELDNVFGPVARGSFQGQVSQAIERAIEPGATLFSTISNATIEGGKKLTGRAQNEEAAFKSIRELLKE